MLCDFRNNCSTSTVMSNPFWRSVLEIGRVHLVYWIAAPLRLKAARNLDHEATLVAPGGLAFPVSLGAVVADILDVPLLQASEPLMRYALSQAGRGGASVVLGSEQFGRQAYLERSATRALGLRHLSVQIVSAPDTVFPDFPLSDMFFASSPAAAEYLSSKNASQRVRFAGTLFGGARDKGAVSTKPRLAFLTQPYEADVTSDILFALHEVCRANGWEMVIRLHPRDYPSRYPQGIRTLLEEQGPVESLDRILSSSSVIVSRTSSVIEEAISRGIPAVACLLSDYDRTHGRLFSSWGDMASGVVCRTDELLDLLLGASESSLEELGRVQQSRSGFAGDASGLVDAILAELS